MFVEEEMNLRFCLGALLALTAPVAPALAADEKITVHVALLDMTSLMPAGMEGYGVMGHGMMGRRMMGEGQGMMGRGQGMMDGMMSVRVDKPTVKAGIMTFAVVNWSRSVVHEALLISVDNQDAPLPYDFAQSRVPEEQVKVLGEAEDLQPNASQSFEVTLGPGTYLLICNVAGHYSSGMATPFSVVP